MDKNKMVRMVVVLTLVFLALSPLTPAMAFPAVVTADISPDCQGGRVTINGFGMYDVLIKVDGVTVLTLNLGPGSYPFTWPQAVLDEICTEHQATLEIGNLVRGPVAFGGPSCCALKPVVIQQGLDGYAGATDTYLNKWLPTKNYGNDGYIRTHTSGEQVGLLRFDLSAIPADASIISATLWLHLEMGLPRAGNAGVALEAPLDATGVYDSALPIFPFHPGTLEIYKQLAGWNANQGTWNQAMTNDPWEAPGGNGPTDREQEPAAIADITFPALPFYTATAKDQQVEVPLFVVLGFNQWISAPVESLVQGWLADPASNQGMWLLAKSEKGQAYPFASSNNWNKLFRPKLVLIYTTPSE